MGIQIEPSCETIGYRLIFSSILVNFKVGVSFLENLDVDFRATGRGIRVGITVLVTIDRVTRLSGSSSLEIFNSRFEPSSLDEERRLLFLLEFKFEFDGGIPLPLAPSFNLFIIAES